MSLAQLPQFDASSLRLTRVCRRSIMAVSLCCSVAQCAHFWSLGEQSGLDGQAVMLAMSVLGYFDSQPVAQRAYWLLYPALLVMAAKQQADRATGAAGAASGVLELLPLIAALISVVARHQTDLFRLRVGTVLSALPWLPFCAAVGSWSNFFGMLVFLLLSSAALLRFHVFATLSEREQWRLTHGTVVGLWLSPVPGGAAQLLGSGDDAPKRHLHAV